ncbi:hypothetical protein [Candidatus Neptunochlamydia vexilliferae]|uniref:Uncharacterized protein n=1 Tax=Candidatus Neptunichlamydia vexilliferae TaxID=1651774 RepID=A0ABS0AWU3_9BACT|nr:hypothetical protein [Candidatus Neptunochlamydia vexilliferae]MBF5058586.1 hypothetical protein [Candidatus Neptunochlamydia vexilliferae]
MKYQTTRLLGQEKERHVLNKKTLGLRFASPKKERKVPLKPLETVGDLLKGLAQFYYEGESLIRDQIAYNRFRVINIESLGIGATDFYLDNKTKEKLIASGVKGTKKFFSSSSSSDYNNGGSSTNRNRKAFSLDSSKPEKKNTNEESSFMNYIYISAGLAVAIGAVAAVAFKVTGLPVSFIFRRVATCRSCKKRFINLSDNSSNGQINESKPNTNTGDEENVTNPNDGASSSNTGNQDVRIGKDIWENHFDNIEGTEGPLPYDITQILNAKSTFEVEGYSKKVRDTHILVWIPERVGGDNISLNSLEKIFRKYRYYSDSIKKEIGAKKIEKATWILISKNVLKNTRNKTYNEQRKSVGAHISKGYTLPKVLELAAALLIYEKEKKKKLLSNSPPTYTRCQERVCNNQWPVAIGNFGAKGLCIDPYWLDSKDCGVIAARRL